MSRPIRLACTTEAYHGLTQALAKVRETSKTVTVSRDALSALMRDHGAVLARLRDGPDYETEEGAAP